MIRLTFSVEELSQTCPQYILKDKLHTDFFVTTIIFMCWTIRGARNGLIFKCFWLSMMDWKRVFARELVL